MQAPTGTLRVQLMTVGWSLNEPTDAKRGAKLEASCLRYVYNIPHHAKLDLTNHRQLFPGHSTRS